MAHLLHANDTSSTIFNLFQYSWIAELPLEDVSLLSLVPILTSLFRHTVSEHIVTHYLNHSSLVDELTRYVVRWVSKVSLNRREVFRIECP